MDDAGEHPNMVSESSLLPLVSSRGGLGEERTERKPEEEIDGDNDAAIRLAIEPAEQLIHL